MIILKFRPTISVQARGVAHAGSRGQDAELDDSPGHGSPDYQGEPVPGT
jgi:hypothetical protein